MNNKLPITRMSKFLSQDDFDLNIQMGEEYLHGDLNMKLVLYRVDRQKTENDDVYAEVGTDEIKYFPPIEFNGLVKNKVIVGFVVKAERGAIRLASGDGNRPTISRIRSRPIGIFDQSRGHGGNGGGIWRADIDVQKIKVFVVQ